MMTGFTLRLAVGACFFIASVLSKTAGKTDKDGNMVYEQYLDVCYFCDGECVAVLTKLYGKNGVNGYTAALTKGVGKALKTLDPSINTRFLMTTTHKKALNLLWFNNNDRTAESLANANTGLWGDMTGLFKTAKKAGCDVAVAIFYVDDAFEYSHVEGIGNMFQVCDDMAYAVVHFNPRNAHAQVALTAHEIGHVLGLNHDFEMEPTYKNPMFKSMFPKEVAWMLKWCVNDKKSGCSDRAGRCIMHPAPIASARAPTSYSKCSIANYAMFRALSAKLPSMYESSCFLGTAPAFDASSILDD